MTPSRISMTGFQRAISASSLAFSAAGVASSAEDGAVPSSPSFSAMAGSASAVCRALVRRSTASAGVRLAVGIPDGLPKLAVHRLLAPVLGEPALRLLCHDGEFEDLLGELALHKLDLVISDRPAPPNPNLRVYSHALGSSPMAWFAAPRWADAAKRDFDGAIGYGIQKSPVVRNQHHCAIVCFQEIFEPLN